MNRVYLLHLAMIITNDCNLNCAHCVQGCKENINMNEEVIKSIFSQTNGIGTLSICGGEPILAIRSIYDIYKYLRDNKISVSEIKTTINGTIFSNDFLELLDEMNYNGYNSTFTISSDKYHDEEIKRLDIKKQYIENLIRYRKTEYYRGTRKLKKNAKLFREGNAVDLDINETIPYKPINVYLTYDEEKKCSIGPLITINPNGIITELDASIEKQKTIYNYGNVLVDEIEKVALSRGRVLKPSKFGIMCQREIEKHNKYSK